MMQYNIPEQLQCVLCIFLYVGLVHERDFPFRNHGEFVGGYLRVISFYVASKFVSRGVLCMGSSIK
jgi:hypothetical protein